MKKFGIILLAVLFVSSFALASPPVPPGQELSLIQTYLPEPLGAEELSTLIQSIISETGASDIRDMGPVMNTLRSQVQGRADMKAVSQAVKAQLSS